MRPIRIRGAALWLALSLSACAPQADDVADTDTDAGVADLDEAAEADPGELPAVTCAYDVERVAPPTTPSPAVAAMADEAVAVQPDPEALAALPVLAQVPPADQVSPVVRKRQQSYLTALAAREPGWSQLDAAAREAAQAALKAEFLGGDQ
jgi:hypothetical protein